MAVKLIAMDLDGTLLNKQKQISPENQMALENARDQGILLAVSTGRPWSAIPACVRENPVFTYAIASNGAEIYRLDTGEVLHDCLLKPESLDVILEIAKKAAGDKTFAWEAFVRGEAYGEERYVNRPWEYGMPSSAIGYVKKTRISVPDIEAFIRDNRERMAVLDLVTGDFELKNTVYEELQKCGEPLYVTPATDERLEILHKDAGKGPGMQVLCELEGIDPSETVAIGDAENDLDMLAFAGISIAMGNAYDSVKKLADYVTCDNDHNGIAEAFRRKLGILSEEERAVHEHFMREALKQAKKAEALAEVPIGCVIVKDGRIISRGYNRRNTDRNTLSHAELNAIRKASGKLGDWRLEGCTMYITLEPCQMCAGALVQSRIDRIVLGGRNPKAGCAGSVLNLLQVEAFNHQVEVLDGILVDECSRQLSSFFQDLREQKKQ